MKRYIFMTILVYGLLQQTNVFARHLVFVSDIIRHGGRTTLYQLTGISYPSLWSSRNIPFGQLTIYGTQEAILFGQSVHAQQQNISGHSSLQNYSQWKVCVRTTGVNRTIMTAQAALIGAYPSIAQTLNSNAYIKLYSVPGNSDNLLLQHDTYKTTQLNHAKAWHDRWQSPMGYQLYRKLEKINPNFFPNSICTQNASRDSTKNCLRAIIPLADNVQTLKDYCHAANACSVRKVLGLNRQQQNQVMAAFAWYAIHSNLPSKEFSHYQKDYQKIGLATGSRLTSELARNMQTAVKNRMQTSPYFLYSAHDATIFGVLSYILSMQPKNSVNTIMQSYPGFVSDVRFLLYEEDNGNYTIEVKYFNNANATKNSTGKIVVKMPFKKFYKTYFVKNKYRTIYEKSSCDYTFGFK